MSDDLVKRLRDAHSFMGDPLLKEAADEIERLRVALEGVIRIADRDCPEFRAARAALAKKGGEHG